MVEILLGKSGRRRQLAKCEIELISDIAEGLENKEIAKRLNVPLTTITGRVRLLTRRLGMENRVQVVTWAFRNGVIR